MRKSLFVLVCLIVFSGMTHAAPGAVRCGKLLDVRSGRMLSDQVISFDANGLITAIGAAGAGSSGSDGAIVDLSHATCLPGLIDMHTHLTSNPTDAGYAALGISVPREAITGVKNARLTLRAGFTTVRNVGASGFTDVALRDGINDGDVEGPRMRVSGPPLGITGGHCDNNLLPSEFHYRVRGRGRQSMGGARKSSRDGQIRSGCNQGLRFGRRAQQGGSAGNPAIHARRDARDC